MLEYPMHFIDDADRNRLLNHLVQEGYPNNRYRDGSTPLHLAARMTEEDLSLAFARKLIDDGAQINARNRFMRSPLHLAVSMRKYRLVQVLLDSGANPSYQDDQGNTALHYAINNCPVKKSLMFECSCVYNHTDRNLVRKLLEYNIDTDILNYYFESALMWAIMEDDFVLVKELLRSNAVTNYRTIREPTSALHIALKQSEPDIHIIRELLLYGADLDSVDDLGNIPFDIAREMYNGSTTHQIIIRSLLRMEILLELDKEDLATERLTQCEGEEIPELVSFFYECVNEVDQMKKDKLERSFSVHDFSLGYFHKSFFKRSDRKKIYDRLFTKLKGHLVYPVYKDVLVYRFERWYLKNQFCKTYVSAKSSHNQKEIVLNYSFLRNLSSYLSNLDMFNFIPELPGELVQEPKSEGWFSILLPWVSCLLKGTIFKRDASNC